MKSDPEVRSSPSVNWARFLDQTKRDYEQLPARGVPHGVQKEAIQNSWGARAGRKPWAFTISPLSRGRGRPLPSTSEI